MMILRRIRIVLCLTIISYLERVIMADLSKLTESVNRLLAKVQSEESALAPLQQQVADLTAHDADLQSQIDSLTASIDAAAPPA